MNKFLDRLRSTDLVSLALEVGLSIYILVSFVRCSFGG